MHMCVHQTIQVYYFYFIFEKNERKIKSEIKIVNSQTVKILFEQVKLNIVSRCIKGFFLTCR